jgi:alpha-tubulin suppressor-like RCC1 family protein
LLTGSGEVHCWGEPFNERTSDVSYPTRQMTLSSTATEIAVGDPLACARLTNDQVECWGAAYGDNGHTAHTVVDASNAPLTHVTRIAAVGTVGAPAAHGCALRSDGRVWCWGYNFSGEIGNGSARTFAFEPATQVRGIDNAVDISVGLQSSCALVSSGQAYCWGNSKAAIGISGTMLTRPTAIPGVTDAIDVASGWNHNCVRRRSGQVSCWGTNFEGELGDGTLVERTTVRDVLTLP